MQKKLTIKEIADLAGVSKATVSRVLNAKPGVSPTTRRKVEEVIKAHSYAPNLVARGLSLRRTGIIGLVVAHTARRLSSHLFFLEFLRGISRVLEGEGFRLILATADSEEDYESSCRNMAHEGLTEGVVVLGVRKNDKRLRHFLQNGVPLVTVGNPLGYPGVSFVDADNYGGARMATEYLIGLGHERILFINGPKAHTGSLAREHGYKAALVAHGTKEHHIVYGDFSFESGYRAIKESLNRGYQPSGVFAASDLAAMGAIIALKEAGIRAGKDASVIGFDDIPYASFFDPPLTTVRQPISEMGEEAGRLILQVLRGVAAPLGKIFPTTLVVRESTVPSRA
ncbi:MAG: LacI family transcriptional regulator [Candidatus Acetothermia bacterium]|jgi:DNA-binding LacI/PurR family transcriptional regulator|nr:LacI family transcriptional regulator [Candidatus Acetothermia bacterium]